jgi:hypothetical protein
MDRNSMMVAICGQITGVILIVSILNAIVRYRRGARAALPSEDVRRLESRLSNMQEALDAVAVEVERISEGQRFTTKLLADRGEIPMEAANGTRLGQGRASR